MWIVASELNPPAAVGAEMNVRRDWELQGFPSLQIDADLACRFALRQSQRSPMSHKPLRPIRRWQQPVVAQELDECRRAAQPTCSHSSGRRCLWPPDRPKRASWNLSVTSRCRWLPWLVPGSNPGGPTKTSGSTMAALPTHLRVPQRRVGLPVCTHRGRLPQELVQERLHPAQRVHPPAVQQRLVHVVGKDDQLVVHVTLAQQLHQPDRLQK